MIGTSIISLPAVSQSSDRCHRLADLTPASTSVSHRMAPLLQPDSGSSRYDSGARSAASFRHQQKRLITGRGALQWTLWYRERQYYRYTRTTGVLQVRREWPTDRARPFRSAAIRVGRRSPVVTCHMSPSRLNCQRGAGRTDRTSTDTPGQAAGDQPLSRSRYALSRGLVSPSAGADPPGPGQVRSAFGRRRGVRSDQDGPTRQSERPSRVSSVPLSGLRGAVSV